MIFKIKIKLYESYYEKPERGFDHLSNQTQSKLFLE